MSKNRRRQEPSERPISNRCPHVFRSSASEARCKLEKGHRGNHAFVLSDLQQARKNDLGPAIESREDKERRERQEQRERRRVQRQKKKRTPEDEALEALKRGETNRSG